jgi:hypothetical protein
MTRRKLMMSRKKLLILTHLRRIRKRKFPKDQQKIVLKNQKLRRLKQMKKRKIELVIKSVKLAWPLWRGPSWDINVKIQPVIQRQTDSPVLFQMTYSMYHYVGSTML